MSISKAIALVMITSLAVSSAWSASSKPPHIAITKITSHPSLDLIEKGILDVLKKAYPQAKITLNNAQGNITIAAQIAQKFAALDPTLVVPITTPSAQTMTKAFRGKSTPLVFSAVTDPIGASLLKSLDESTATLTGVVDQPPVKETVKIMLKVAPKLKSVGVIYNAGEANSEFQVAAFRLAAEAAGLSVREVPVAKVSDIQMATASLASDVGAIFLPNDNLVISSLESIIKIAHQKSIPVYASDPESIGRGAFVALAVDQYDIGKATGELVLQVLESGSAEDHPPILLNKPHFYVNESVAKYLGVSKALIKELDKIYNNLSLH